MDDFLNSEGITLSPRVVFPNKTLPYLLVAPQLAITLADRAGALPVDA